MLVAVIGTGLSIGCSKEAAPPPAPPAAPAPPPPPAPAPAAEAASPDAGPKKPKMVAPTDGLSLADRIAKRQADEKKLADELASAEKTRLLKYDKTKLPLHQQVWGAIKKTRDAYAKAKTKEDVEKIRAAQQKTIDATGKKMTTIDPKGGNSNVVTDYDVMLDALSNGYPDALAESFGGDKKPLADVTAELDKRSKKIESWLAEVKAAKK
jgi:pyruvate/2-oxoglutarate dehydrogenase complex dihydrolipoamide acyltransferase (E2) component